MHGELEQRAMRDRPRLDQVVEPLEGDPDPWWQFRHPLDKIRNVSGGVVAVAPAAGHWLALPGTTWFVAFAAGITAFLGATLAEFIARWRHR